jgi:predicted membrane protein
MTAVVEWAIVGTVIALSAGVALRVMVREAGSWDELKRRQFSHGLSPVPGTAVLGTAVAAVLVVDPTDAIDSWEWAGVLVRLGVAALAAWLVLRNRRSQR